MSVRIRSVLCVGLLGLKKKKNIIYLCSTKYSNELCCRQGGSSKASLTESKHFALILQQLKSKKTRKNPLSHVLILLPVLLDMCGIFRAFNIVENPKVENGETRKIVLIKLLYKFLSSSAHLKAFSVSGSLFAFHVQKLL